MVRLKVQNANETCTLHHFSGLFPIKVDNNQAFRFTIISLKVDNKSREGQMARLRKRGETIRQFILDNVERHPSDIVQIAAEKFDVSRQAINKHIRQLIEQKTLIMSGQTKDRRYGLPPIKEATKTFFLDNSLQEDVVWRNEISVLLSGFPDNVIEVWNYCFTEILNNAIDHSSGQTVTINFKRNAVSTEIHILDDGEGIFKKIQREMGLLDERHAVLELSKGKLTTDPSRHTGEGIFFSSRMVDDFEILSGGVFFSHKHTEESDWILERYQPGKGTVVYMKMKNNSSRSVKKVFDAYTTSEDYGFNKTIVPVRLAQYGNEMLVSRSQAKRLLSRIDRFKTVILDFKGVDSIGQAFADEIFRVFAMKNKDINLLHVNASREVEQMIMRALLNAD
jgi:anti-sigma regulatory factor (Ser/Thr protein kinase)